MREREREREKERERERSLKETKERGIEINGKKETDKLERKEYKI